MDLVRTIVKSGEARMAIHAFQRGILGNPERTVNLDGTINCVVQHACTVNFDQSDLYPGFISLVNFLRGVQSKQSCRLDFYSGIKDKLLDLLVLPQSFTKGDPTIGSRAHEIKSALCLPKPAHTVEYSAGTESVLRNLKSLASRTKKVVFGYTDVIVVDFLVTIVCTHNAYIAQNVVSRCVGGNNDHRKRGVIRGIVLRPDHDCCIGGVAGA